MSKKQMTPTLAKALANQVQASLIKKINAPETADSIRNTIEKTKEWKKYVKIKAEIKSLTHAAEELSRELEVKYSNEFVKIDIHCWNDPWVRVQERYQYRSLEFIRDVILVEDYTSSGTETSEELIERISNKLLKS